MLAHFKKIRFATGFLEFVIKSQHFKSRHQDWEKETWLSVCVCGRARFGFRITKPDFRQKTIESEWNGPFERIFFSMHKLSSFFDQWDQH